MFCPRQKNNFQDIIKIRGTLVFLCPKKRVRERESEQEQKRARAKARVRAGKGKRKGQGKGQGKGKGKRESTKALVILFLNHLGQSKKYANCTVQERAVQYEQLKTPGKQIR
jgi:hypothetical protein